MKYISPLSFPCAPNRHYVFSWLEGACVGRLMARRLSSAAWAVEDPSILLVYPCRNHHPRNALSIRTHSRGNWEEGFRDALQRSIFCADQDLWEIGGKTVQDASRFYLSSQQQRRTAFLPASTNIPCGQLPSMTSRNGLHHLDFQA